MSEMASNLSTQHQLDSNATEKRSHRSKSAPNQLKLVSNVTEKLSTRSKSIPKHRGITPSILIIKSSRSTPMRRLCSTPKSLKNSLFTDRNNFFLSSLPSSSSSTTTILPNFSKYAGSSAKKHRGSKVSLRQAQEDENDDDNEHLGQYRKVKSRQATIHPPCFNYTSNYEFTLNLEVLPFANRIELFRPGPNHFSRSLHPIPREIIAAEDLRDDKVPYEVYPAWITHRRVSSGIAPDKWFAYPPECIESAIRSRCLPDISVSKVAWCLLENFGAAYKVSITWNTREEEFLQDFEAVLDNNDANEKYTITSVDNELSEDEFLIPNFKVDEDTKWCIWINDRLPPRWAALAWDYMAEASGWKEDRQLFKTAGSHFELSLDSYALEQLVNQRMATSLAYIASLAAERANESIETTSDAKFDAQKTFLSEGIDIEHVVPSIEEDISPDRHSNFSKVSTLNDDLTETTSSSEYKSDEDDDGIHSRWDNIQKRNYEESLRMQEWKCTKAYEESLTHRRFKGGVTPPPTTVKWPVRNW